MQKYPEGVHWFILAVVCGCGGDLIDGNADGSGGRPDISTERQGAPVACGNSDVTGFSAGGTYGYTQMEPTSSHICWLAQVTGDGSSRPRALVTRTYGAWWVLDTRSYAGQQVGTAYCAPRDCFFSNNPGYDVNWVGDDSAVGASASGGQCQEVIGNAWQGDATTLLNGWETHSLTTYLGKVTSPWEYGDIILKNSPTLTAFAKIQDCYIDGYKRNMRYNSYFVGVPGGTHWAVYKGPYSARSHGISNAEQYLVGSTIGGAETSMAFTDEGMCFFTKVGGDFNGPSEVARIFRRYVPGVGRHQWVLRAQHGSETNGVISAAAACYLYDQSQDH